MSLIASYAMTIEENADRDDVTIQRWVGGYPGGTLFDWTGYSASWEFRINVSDVSPVLTLTPVFSTGGSYTDTLTLSFSSANANTLVSAVASLSGFQDVKLVSATSKISYLWIQQPFTLVRAVTRP